MTKSRLKNSSNGIKYFVFLQIGCFVFAIVQFSTITSQFWMNIGFLQLTRVMMTGDLLAPSIETRQAATGPEHWLRRATVIDPRNESAVRGLGFALLAQGREDEAVKMWENGDFSAQDFITFGRTADTAEQYADALIWYRVATQIDPGLGDPWYYIGFLSQNQQNWSMALNAYEKALQTGNFNLVGKSDVYFRHGLIYQKAKEYKDLDKALSLYNIALQLDDFNSTRWKAETFYKRGEIYFLQGRDPNESIQEYQKALALYPDHFWAHLRLGYALYWATKDVQIAEEEIQIAIALLPPDSSNRYPYRYLGDIYYDAGLDEKAIDAYKQAQTLNSTDKYVQKQLELLLSKNHSNQQ